MSIPWSWRFVSIFVFAFRMEVFFVLSFTSRSMIYIWLNFTNGVVELRVYFFPEGTINPRPFIERLLLPLWTVVVPWSSVTGDHIFMSFVDFYSIGLLIILVPMPWHLVCYSFKMSFDIQFYPSVWPDFSITFKHYTFVVS